MKANLAEHRDQVFLNRRSDDHGRRARCGPRPSKPSRPGSGTTTVRKVFDGLEFHRCGNGLVELGGPAGRDGRDRGGDPACRHRRRGRGPRRAKSAVSDWSTTGRPFGLAVSAGRSTRPVSSPWMPRAHCSKPWSRDRRRSSATMSRRCSAVLLASTMTSPGSSSTRPGRLRGQPRPARATTSRSSPTTMARRRAGLPVEVADCGRDADFDTGPDLEMDRAAARGRAPALGTDALRADRAGRGRPYEEFELPLVAVLARMEDAGIGVDRAYLEAGRRSAASGSPSWSAIPPELAGEPFNVNSTLQLRAVLFDKLGLPALKKTSTGAPSTDASVLEKLASPPAGRRTSSSTASWRSSAPPMSTAICR